MDKLSMAIIAMEAHIAVTNERMRQAWEIIHAKLVEEKFTPTNTCVMPLPSIEEVEVHVSGDLMLPLLNNSERNIIKSVYEFIRSRQQHNT